MVITLYAGILGLFYIALSAYVIQGRFKYGVSLGDAGNDTMIKRVRSHGNFIEYVPLALILIILAEFEGTSELIINGLGIFLVIGRLMHAYGLLGTNSNSLARRGGMIVTFTVIAVASLLCISSFFIL